MKLGGILTYKLFEVVTPTKCTLATWATFVCRLQMSAKKALRRTKIRPPTCLKRNVKKAKPHQERSRTLTL